MTDDMIRVAEDSARGGFFLISGTAFATAIMAIASVLIGRVLGSESYGQYTLAFVVPQLLFLFADLGINQGIIKFSANYRAKGETVRLTRMVKYALLIKALIGTVIFLVNFTLAR
jgi:O-antigen/teichoic acid export membrane protein